LADHEQVARTVTCSACGAKPGEPCRRVGFYASLGPLPKAHKSRYEAGLAAEGKQGRPAK